VAITLRQLTDDEKAVVLRRHGRTCFATGHEIASDDSVQFDHIKAFSSGGPTNLNNIAPMCGRHNNDKGTLPLFDYRAKLQLQDFFSQGDQLTLGHLLAYLQDKGELQHYGQSINVHQSEATISIGSSHYSYDFPLCRCPITGWDYFYATLPVELIGSDDDHDEGIGLQPRYLIFDKVFDLFRHFQNSPVLQPSLGRIVDGKIRLFDGQHKAAAILWNNHRALECKIYTHPDMRLLNQTNISAHEKFAQTRFYTSIMVLKLGSQFGQDFERYKNLEDGNVKSEAGFLDYLMAEDSLTKGEATKRFRSFLYNSVLQEEDNRLSRLVAISNRASEERPLTLNGLTNSLFASFLYREPVRDNMTTDAYMREFEIDNMVRLMNMLDEVGLSQWNATAGKTADHHLKLSRIIRARFMKTWSGLLKDVVCAQLNLHDSDERSKPFYRRLQDNHFEQIRACVARLFDWQMWESPANAEIDRVRSDSDTEVKNWLKEKGLTTGYLLGASE